MGDILRKFSKAQNGYNIDEVNEFLDSVISELEKIIYSNKQKDREIKELNKKIEELSDEKRIKELIDSLNNNIEKAKANGDKIRLAAIQERNLILSEARNEAEDIIKDAIYKTNKLEEQAEELRKNIIDFKSKIVKINDRDEHI